MAPKSKKRKFNKVDKDLNSYKEADPDPTSEDFLYDDVDKFHLDQEKILLSKTNYYDRRSDSKVTDEILGVASDSDEDDEKIEEYERQLKRFKGYADYETQEVDKASDNEEMPQLEDDLPSDADDDQLEEKEALQLQKKLNSYLDENDFGLSLIQSACSNVSEFKNIQNNLSDLTLKEKKVLLLQESPELFKLIDELKSKLSLILKVYSNFKARSDGTSKFHLKLLLDYCANLNFYLALKFQREDVTNHPVIDRICYYSDILKSFAKGALVSMTSKNINKSAELSFLADEFQKIEDDVEDGDEVVDTRRGINKTIEKNRGLTPHRKKENKNPRVKHRNKYRKSKIRRKGQIREPRKELVKYSGEISGIKPGIKRGIKMK
ncbi:hypothetical protein HELRODRAFT_190072 [Helobdella robusta]|uniref:Sas10 C-terminal domain-containing protein n=1 Tax=Helobdella robusta TaxID=6412 RepID=T1FRN4_HELRO|nr:hypothetical protein HELRODRAFT_190072 [Helobdella robusta]ESO11893.1 hypothetical protein HELRODRAFT_190072 [Helobdella robusta]